MDKIKSLQEQLQQLQISNHNKHMDYIAGRTFVKIQMSNILNSGSLTLSMQLARNHPQFKILATIIDRLNDYKVEGISVNVANTLEFKNGVIEMKLILCSIVKGNDGILDLASSTIIYNTIASKIKSIKQLCES